jgi:BASS family bile acid:Na+ symporter
VDPADDRGLHDGPTAWATAEIKAGTLLVAAAPVAGLSGYYTQLAGGHLALAVTVAAVSNVFAVIVTPVVATAGFDGFSPAGAAFNLPAAGVAKQTFIGLLAPLLFGMLIRHRAAHRLQHWRRPLQGLAMLAILIVLGLVAVNQIAAIRAQFGILLGVSVLFTLVMVTAGLLVAKLVARSSEDRRAIPWGFPARNAALATLIATSAMGQVAVASFLAVLFVAQLVMLTSLALWLRRRATIGTMARQARTP